jgi:mannose-6-phosphate isomerase-like protein (cupin superfamily)
MSPDRRAVTLHHDLAGRPEFDLQAISRVAATLDPADIEQHAADIPILHHSGQVRRLRQSFDEIVASEAAANWWVMLAGGLDRVEPFEALATEVATPWLQTVTRAEGGLNGRFVTVFVSSPDSVVPHHIDYQHNVLAQISGTKEVTIGRVSEEVIEGCVTSGVRNLRAVPEVTETFVLHPGDGLYIPPCTPHSVVGLDGISVSLSSMWMTPWTDTEYMARYWNAWLRRRGFRPAAPSGGRLLDRAKSTTATLHGRKARRRTAA